MGEASHLSPIVVISLKNHPESVTFGDFSLDFARFRANFAISSPNMEDWAIFDCFPTNSEIKPVVLGIELYFRLSQRLRHWDSLKVRAVNAQ
jgi:hypothetical protein